MIGHFATADQKPGQNPCDLFAVDGNGFECRETFPANRFIAAYQRYIALVNNEAWAYVRLIGPSGVIREFGDTSAA